MSPLPPVPPPPRKDGLMGRFDPRGILAVLAVICAFALQGYLTYQDSTAQMPSWVVSLVSAVVAFYFGYKSGNGKGGVT